MSAQERLRFARLQLPSIIPKMDFNHISLYRFFSICLPFSTLKTVPLQLFVIEIIFSTLVLFYFYLL